MKDDVQKSGRVISALESFSPLWENAEGLKQYSRNNILFHLTGAKPIDRSCLKLEENLKLQQKDSYRAIFEIKVKKKLLRLILLL